MTDVLSIQRALQARGYDIGKEGADGVLGRLTIAAVANFQADRKLDIKYPGSIGPKTLAALGLDAPALVVPPWLVEAKRFFGLQEVRDAKVLDRALHMDASAIPWCGAFQAMVMATVLPHEPLPANPLWALNWQKFGRETGVIAAGAIVTFKRSGGGHVAQVVGHDKTYWHCLGGNQSNAVTITKIAKSRQYGELRWPLSYALPEVALTMSDIHATVSANEA